MKQMKLRKPEIELLYRVCFLCLVYFLICALVLSIENFLVLTVLSGVSHFVMFMASSVAVFTNFLALSVLMQRTLYSMTRRVYGADASCRLKQEKIRQASAQIIYCSAVACYVFFACKAAFLAHGIGDWITGWIFTSLRDAAIVAHLPTAPVYFISGLVYPNVIDAGGRMTLVKEYANLHNLVRSLLALSLVVLPFRLVSRAAAFVTLLCQRFARRFDATIDSALVETLRTRELQVTIFDEHPQVVKVVHSLTWLGFCYALLFWLFGFSGGVLGGTISSFLEFSIRDAWHSSYANIHALRPFLGAVIASYATVPFAIMSSVFLPARKPALMVLNSDAILFSENYLFPLNFCIRRSMNDLKGISLELNNLDYQKSTLRLSFFSGGSFSCKLKQLEKIDLKHLICFVDQSALDCVLDANVLALKLQLAEEVSPGSEVPESSSMEFEAGESFDKENVRERLAEFKSASFIPYAPDTVLQSGAFRVVKQLSSKPDSALYLVRRKEGRLGLLKQIVVAEELSVKLRHSSETTEITAPPTSPPEPIELARTASAGSQSAAHISEISERFCIDSSIYVSYDYAPGEDLQTLVSRLGPSRELEVMAWAIQLAEMMDLHHQHAEPPIYGVLRPSKLILDNMGSIHLTNASTLEQSLDGVVSFNTRAKTSNGASRVIVGEQSYTSPEQLRGNAACQSDDIYSFGCTLFYLLTGRQPEALRPADLSLENILLSNWFIELIKACTAFEPAARPKTFAEILHILKSHESMPESLKCRRKYESSLTHGPLESSQTPSEFILRLAGCSSLCTTDDSAIIDLTSKQRAEVKF